MQITFNLYNKNYNTNFAGVNIKGLTKEIYKDLTAKGYNNRQIAEMYNCSPAKLYLYRKELNLGINPKNAAIDYDRFDSRQIKILIDEGNSLNQISKILGESMSTVRSILKHFELKTQQSQLSTYIDENKLRAMAEAGMSQKQIAKEFMIEDTGTLTPIMKKCGISASKSIYENISYAELSEMVDSGMPVKKIANYYNIAPRFIEQRLKDLGLETRIMRSKRLEIPKEELQLHLEMGLTFSEIAKKYQVSYNKLKKILNKNGLSSTR